MIMSAAGLIILMGVAHLSVLVDPSNSQNRRDGVAFPPYTPITIIEFERASMPDLLSRM